MFPSPSLGPPLLSESWSPPLFCGMPLGTGFGVGFGVDLRTTFAAADETAFH
jgi:hypothetical protein